jgi:hypothetical protein
VRNGQQAPPSRDRTPGGVVAGARQPDICLNLCCAEGGSQTQYSPAERGPPLCECLEQSKWERAGSQLGVFVSTETLSRGALFAQMQSECLRLGVKPNADLTGLQKIAKAMCDAAADEAVAAATLFVTEVEIAQACNDFAVSEEEAGRLPNVARLRQAAKMILECVGHARGAEVKAIVRLSRGSEVLPPKIRERVERVGRLISPKISTDHAPLRRLVAELIGEAYDVGRTYGVSALAFYADPHSYVRRGPPHDPGATPIVADHGSRARKALGLIGDAAAPGLAAPE